MTYLGETPTTDGLYTVVEFLETGEFVTPDGVTTGTSLVQAGGGGGAAGGGGGGGQLSGAQALSGTMTVTVGLGGTAGSGYDGSPEHPGKGGDSVLGTRTAEGGGVGGVRGVGGNHPAGDGGCGGGGHYLDSAQTYGGNGTQGYDGGGNGGYTASPYPAGGGGGMGGLGGDATSASAPGSGGVGLASSITGSSVTYGAGGAGAKYTDTVTGASGAANTGDGGAGAGGTKTAGAGGSGKVVVRYKTPGVLSAHGLVSLNGYARINKDAMRAIGGTVLLSGVAWFGTRILAHGPVATLGGRGLLGSETRMRARYGAVTLGGEPPHLGNAHAGGLAAYGVFFTGSHARLANVGDVLPARETGLLRPDIFYRHGFALGIEGLTHRAGILDISIDLSDHGGFIAATIVTAEIGGGKAPAMYSDCVIVCGGQTFRGRLESRQKNVDSTAGWTLTYAGPMTQLRDHRGFRRCYVTSDLQGWSTDQGARSSPDTFEVVSRTSGNTA